MASDTYTVERSTTIEAAPQRIYEQISDFHNWTNWSPWEGLDPDLRRSYSGAESGVGAAYAWSGNRKAGQGRMQITSAVAPSTIAIALVFEKPFKSMSDTVFTVTPEGAGARVTWTMSGKSSLMLKVMGIFTSMDKLIGPDFEKGLARLKVTAEQPGA
jgi:hypothetical protein